MDNDAAERATDLQSAAVRIGVGRVVASEGAAHGAAREPHADRDSGVTAVLELGHLGGD
jgi:hypothetical protein